MMMFVYCAKRTKHNNQGLAPIAVSRCSSLIIIECSAVCLWLVLQTSSLAAALPAELIAKPTSGGHCRCDWSSHRQAPNRTHVSRTAAALLCIAFSKRFRKSTEQAIARQLTIPDSQVVQIRMRFIDDSLVHARVLDLDQN